MSYHSYEADCFILAEENSGEGSKRLFLLCDGLGPIFAHAQSLRKMNSKLRYSLQNQSSARVTLVRGKDTWRVTGAISEDKFWCKLHGKIEEERILRRLSSYLRKVLVGEESGRELYLVFKGLAQYLFNNESTKEDLLIIELIVIARILSRLGFFSYPEISKILLDTNITEEYVSLLREKKNVLLEKVNSAIKSSEV